jgi:hypothetical protein
VRGVAKPSVELTQCLLQLLDQAVLGGDPCRRLRIAEAAGSETRGTIGCSTTENRPATDFPAR